MRVATRIAKNTGILYGKMAITMFISLYSTRLTFSTLGVADFGIFNIVAGTITMLTFLNAAMAGATQRFMSHAEGEGDIIRSRSIFNVSLVLHLFIALVILFIFEAVGDFLFSGILSIPENRMRASKLVYQFMIISTLLSIVSVPYDAVINAHENMLMVAILGILEAFLKLGVAFYIIYTSSDKLIVYGLLTASSSIILLLIHRVYCHKKYKECTISIKKYFDKNIFKELIGYAGWSFLAAAVTMLTGYGQGIIMNMFFGPKVNAAQGISNQVSGQLSSMANTMLQALFPTIAKSEGAGERDRMLNIAMQGTKFGFFILSIFYIPFFIEIQFLFKLWLKIIPEYVIIFCQFQLIKNLIDHCYVTMASTIGAAGNLKMYQIFRTIISVPIIPFIYLGYVLKLPPQFSYIVLILFSLIFCIVTLVVIKQQFGLSYFVFFKKVILPFLPVFFITFFITYLPKFYFTESFFRLIFITGSSFISVIICIWKFGLSLSEKQQMVNFYFMLIKKTNC